ncbi:phosphatidylinositol phosphatase PTPRQ [Sardina pilchardus]|uniref:phosphatidylinositol phosphatase PTPRQ n=1 Tax=Sardina pilchardus TaxID=27697 RepID=UPI002E0E2A68
MTLQALIDTQRLQTKVFKISLVKSSMLRAAVSSSSAVLTWISLGPEHIYSVLTSGLQLVDVWETAAHLSWDADAAKMTNGMQLSLHYQEPDSAESTASRWLPYSPIHTPLQAQGRVTVLGLSPGHAYRFALRATHTTGAWQTLGPLLTQSLNRELWVNSSLCASLSMLTAGETYEVGVATVRGGNKSEEKRIRQTLQPEGVLFAMPFSAHTHSVVLYVQLPLTSVYDGVCVSHGHNSSWMPVSRGDDKVTVGDLSPGSEYDLTVFVTSEEMTSDGHVYEGSVTDSSIEILWDPADGHTQRYEAMCLDCTDTVVVQKVLEERAVFGGFIPGRVFNFSVRSEKEAYRDSPAVYISIRYALRSDPKTSRDARIHGNSISLRDLLRGSDYDLSIRTILGEDMSDTFSTRFSTRQFDFLRVAISNRSAFWELRVGRGGQEVTVGGLREGCPYNATVERADVGGLTPGTSYSVTLNAVSPSANSAPVSRIVTTNASAPAAPSDLEGERVGSNGILLSWKTPHDDSIQSFVLQYKEVCPHPDAAFTELTRSLDIPEYLLNTLSPGATYNIKVGSENRDGIRSFSKSLFIKTSEASPGLVTNLTAVPNNHSFVKVTWFLPKRINGLITKFAVKAKHARTGQTVETLEVNAEDIMTGALPHCNDAADILSRGTPSPDESLSTSASVPPVTLSAIPPASSWSVPISVGMARLRPYTAYVFEVSAFTSDGEGQIASTMARTPESAPEDPPENLMVGNVTSQSISLSWEAPAIITGRFSYVLELYGPTGFIFDNSTVDLKFVYSGLTPYTLYRISVRAKSAGAVGPDATEFVLTAAEAPSAVSQLSAEAEDSTSVRLSWRMPAQPNGPIIRYRIRVLYNDLTVQDITLHGLQESNGTDDAEGMSSRRRYGRSADFTTATPVSAFTLSAVPTHLHTAALGLTSTSSEQFSDAPPEVTATDPNTQTDTNPTFTSDLSLSSVAPPSPLPWLTVTPDTTADSSEQNDTDPITMTAPSDLSPLTSGTDEQHTNTGATASGHTLQTRAATRAAVTGGIEVLPASEEVIDLSDEMLYLVGSLRPFTEYSFSVSAYTTVGEGPETHVSETTREQVPSSVQAVTYENVTSTSIMVTWEPPLQPNGQITHYTVYSLDLNTQQTRTHSTSNTSILITGLEKYSGYKLRVAASTMVGESPLSEEDDIYVITLEDEPDSPPRDLTLVETTASTATVSWQLPEKPNGIIRVYEVSYGIVSYTHTFNTTSLSVTLHHLRPYTYYNITVRAYTLHGHGDQVSNTLQILSGEDVPGSPAYGLSYESLSPSEVNVSWAPPLQPNGLVLLYHVELWNATHALNLSTPAPHLLLTNLRKYARYRLSVMAATRVGTGNYSSEILNITTLEDVPSSPPQFLLARKVSDYEVLLTWTAPMEANSEVLYYVFASLVSASWWLVSGVSVGVSYSVWLTSSTAAGDGGVASPPINVTTLEDVPSGPIHNLSAQIFSSTTIIVSWDPPVEPNGRVFYQLTLQEAGTTHPSVNRTTNRTISKTTTDTVYLFTKLRKYFPYVFRVTPATRAGAALNYTSMLHVRTDEDAASRNLSSSSILVRWSAPADPNGEIIEYVVVLQGLGLYNTTYTPNTHLTLTHLTPYTPYNLSVADQPQGHGPPSLMLDLHTDEAGPMSPPRSLEIFNHTSDSVWLHWEPSLEPNGQVQHYGFRILDLSTDTLTFQNSTGPSTQAELSGFRPHRMYEITVCTYTRAGNGDQYSLPVIFTTNESAPGPPGALRVVDVQPSSVTLWWAAPPVLSGRLQGYQLEVQLLLQGCVEGQGDQPQDQPQPGASCLDTEVLVWTNGTGGNETLTLHSLQKYRPYRFRVAAYTSAGKGEPTEWVHTHTEAGDPEAPPRSVAVVPSSSALRIQWEPPAVITGPTSYLIHVSSMDGTELNRTVVRRPEEVRTVVVGNLTAFTLYSVTVLAFTGDETEAGENGQASEPVLIRTLEEEPKDPPKNLTLMVLPEEVTRVMVTFSPPEEPNGNISAYRVSVFRNGQLEFHIDHLNVIMHPNHSMSAVIDGLKGGHNYSIRVSPPKPTRRPQPALDRGGVVMSTARRIFIQMPACFFSDDHGPIRKVQVIVSEPAVMDSKNLSSWRTVFLHQPAPYVTDDGFPNPACTEEEERLAPNPNAHTLTHTYIIGDDDGFKFRATNIQGQYTDSEYSERVRTADDNVLTRDEQIIMGVLLSFFLALFLILLIYASVRIHQRKLEGGTYSPREAEIVDTKFKLDQLIAVADLELKEEKINRLLSYRKSLKPVTKKGFLQHVEELCANDNAKFQEEFSELPKLLPDLATSDADLPWNRSKNRFTNIKPYNNNRVKLLSEPGMPGSDYINASFISGYLCPNEFIATQGPLPGTVADFWRMIWETRTKTIAMLTQCFEKGRIRCHQYWPEDNKPVTVFGDIVITKLTEDVYPDWTVRALRVERHGDYMVVHHFNYTSWPEHGVPESSTTLIQFVKSIRSNRGHDNTTIVVHCSAGVGRTGVFIALDHLIQHARDHDFVDIYGLVAELRSERMCMVQNLAQYMFLHQSTLDLLSSKSNSQSIWFVNYSALEKMDSLDAMEGDVELEWEETTM